jgi:CDP-4-dehydro-6-deoxyglucose reductase
VAQWVTIWRAAQLVEVPRGVLQQRVRLGEIELTDGLVSTEALLALYPQAKLELSGGMAERVAQIRDESFGRRVRERLLPSQEVLAQRMFRQSQELADVRHHLQRRLDDGLARVLATEPADALDIMDDLL